MKCLRCQHENQSGAKFCQECAAPLTRPCSNCGSRLPEGAKFCPECAHPLASSPTTLQRFGSPDSYTPKHLAERILTSKGALEGERKQVTVLFADVKGSMELLADRDPEEARNILDPVLERMMEAVHRYEGTVNQVMGDGIMALFGAPLAHEDHSVRACYAALRMQQAISRYADELRRSQALDVQIRVGINSGDVVVRSVGSDLRMDYTAVGQTTHLAARMEQLARPGTTLLSSPTLKLAEGFLQVRPLGAMPIKGLNEPVEVFELAGAGSARTRLQAAAGRGLTHFVGRQRELEVLADALTSARRGKGQAVAIVGEPGVGKSRLFWEFLRSHRTQGWLTVEAGSVSYGKATPYLPVIDLLKAYFKIGDRDDARGIKEKVTGKLLTLDRALESLLSPLLALLDQPIEDSQWQQLDPPQRRRRTLDALEHMWLRESQTQPLILVFEDLHWIDTETQEFLDRLVEKIPTNSLLLLFNYRPEYRHPWGGKTYYTQLRLDPLTAESADALLSALIGSDRGLQPLKHLLIERTEGNPFFLEESVRALIEAGALDGERGNYRLLRPAVSAEVPATVQAILAARIDRLSAEDKRLLQTAAVIGKDVPYALLQAIAEMSEDTLRRCLARLQAAEFLYETSLFPDLEYTFKHALTHDVAYASLLQERKRALHARIAAAIETLHGERIDEQVERLAHHALHAELRDKALRYLRQAASKASARWAFREAARYLEQALDVIAGLPDRDDLAEQELDVLLRLRAALLPLAQFNKVSQVLQRAFELAERVGDRRRLGRLRSFHSQVSIELCNPHDAIVSGQAALKIAHEIEDAELSLLARHNLAGAYFTLGEFRQAVDVGRPCVVANDEFIVNSIRSGVIGTLPYFLLQSLAELGLFREATDGETTLMGRADAGGDPFSIAMMGAAVGYAKLRRGVPKRAVPGLERAMTLCRSYAIDVQIPWCASTLGLAYAFIGQHAQAKEHAELAVEHAERLGIVRYQPLRLSILSNVYFLAGRREEAHATAQKALEFAHRYHEKGPETWAIWLLAASEDSSVAGGVGRALDGYRDALLRADQLDMRPLSAHCYLGLGKLYSALGDTSQAGEHLQRALALYREMDMQYWPEQAEEMLKRLDVGRPLSR